MNSENKLYRTDNVLVRGRNEEVNAIIVAPNQSTALTLANNYLRTRRIITYPLNENNFVEIKPYDNSVFCLSKHE